MQEGAQKAADANNVDLSIAAGKEDGDEDGQVQAIENAVCAAIRASSSSPTGPE